MGAVLHAYTSRALTQSYIFSFLHDVFSSTFYCSGALHGQDNAVINGIRAVACEYIVVLHVVLDIHLQRQWFFWDSARTQHIS
jgi:hypothetical protein